MGLRAARVRAKAHADTCVARAYHPPSLEAPRITSRQPKLLSPPAGAPHFTPHTQRNVNAASTTASSSASSGVAFASGITFDGAAVACKLPADFAAGARPHQRAQLLVDRAYAPRLIGRADPLPPRGLLRPGLEPVSSCCRPHPPRQQFTRRLRPRGETTADAATLGHACRPERESDGGDQNGGSALPRPHASSDRSE